MTHAPTVQGWPRRCRVIGSSAGGPALHVRRPSGVPIPRTGTVAEERVGERRPVRGGRREGAPAL